MRCSTETCIIVDNLSLHSHREEIITVDLAAAAEYGVNADVTLRNFLQ